VTINDAADGKIATSVDEGTHGLSVASILLSKLSTRVKQTNKQKQNKQTSSSTCPHANSRTVAELKRWTLHELYEYDVGAANLLVYLYKTDSPAVHSSSAGPSAMAT
jgi:hypothetical protein